MNPSDTPMRILVLTDRYPEDPPHAATGWLISHVNALRSFADVDVVGVQRVFPRVKSMLSRRAGEAKARPRIFPLTHMRDERGGRVFLRRALTLPDALSWGLTAQLISLQHGRFLRRLCRDRRPEVIVVHFTHPSAGIALACGRRFGIPVCIAANDTPAFYAAEGKHRAVRWMRRRLERTDRVVTQCGSHAAAVEHLIAHRRISVIPLGIEPQFAAAEPSSFREQTSAPQSSAASADLPQPFYCLFVGRLDDRLKHLDAVLRGIPTARAHTEADIRLTVAGDGILRGHFERLASALGIAPFVDFSGWVSREELPVLYRRHHLFVFPSEIESFGLVYIEAAAAGLPIVARAGTGVVPELAACGAAVQQIDESTADAVSTAVTDSVRRYEQLRADAIRAVPVVMDRFSWDEHARRWEDLLKKTVMP